MGFMDKLNDLAKKAQDKIQEVTAKVTAPVVAAAHEPVQDWYYTIDGKTKHGPFSFDQLKQLAEAGQLQPSQWSGKKGQRNGRRLGRLQRSGRTRRLHHQSRSILPRPKPVLHHCRRIRTRSGTTPQTDSKRGLCRSRSCGNSSVQASYFRLTWCGRKAWQRGPLLVPSTVCFLGLLKSRRRFHQSLQHHPCHPRSMPIE